MNESDGPQGRGIGQVNDADHFAHNSSSCYPLARASSRSMSNRELHKLN